MHRAMLEHAGQGFWNGSHPPFGYAVEVQERRGTKDKKVLVLRDDEAALAKQIFSLATGTEGDRWVSRPLPPTLTSVVSRAAVGASDRQRPWTFLIVDVLRAALFQPQRQPKRPPTAPVAMGRTQASGDLTMRNLHMPCRP